MVDQEDREKIAALLETMRIVTLEELSGNLQDRYDEKYLVPEALYTEFLREVGKDYRVLEVDGVKDYRYVSSYLDLPGFPMYLAHHNGKKNRYKVRYRRYKDSGKVYLEVKHKINKGKTLKSRMEVDHEKEQPEGEEIGFLRERTPYDPLLMHLMLKVSFSRITLAAPGGSERITYDHGLHFNARGEEKDLPGLGVLEIKHSGRKNYSPMTTLLQRYRIFPRGFSKYCTGILLGYPGVKYNRFKPMLKLIKENYYDVTADFAGSR